MTIEERINAASSVINSYKNELLVQKGSKEQIIKSREEDEHNLEIYQKEQNIHYKAQLFLLSEIVDRRKESVQSIEEMGTYALKTVYKEGYKLFLETHEEDRKDGQPNFKMNINIISPRKGKDSITPLEDSRGGGVVEVVSFALRIAALGWLGYDGPILLDEAYKSMSSDDKIHSVALFLKEISQYTDRQMIFATHKADVFGEIADRIIKISNDDGVANYEVIDDYEDCY